MKIVHDGHFHMSQDVFEAIQKQQMKAIANACFPQEFEQLERMRKEYPLFISCGIHPWYVDRLDFQTMRSYISRSDFVGEIGLDCTWCQTDLKQQAEVFEQQLQYAKQLQKPVILHIKDMEEEVLSYLRLYPNCYLVHWYACMDFLQEYIDLDCYFTIGPSIDSDPAVQQVARTVPLNRILIESDGIEAIAWAKNCTVDEVDYLGTLQATIAWIANERGMQIQDLEAQLDFNFTCFLNCSK